MKNTTAVISLLQKISCVEFEHKGLKHSLEKMAFSSIEQTGRFYNTNLSNR